MRVTLEVRLDVTEEEIRKAFSHLGKIEVSEEIRRFREHKKNEEVWFRRSMELDFLPFKGMPFDLRILDPDYDKHIARFIVEEVEWSEVYGGIRIFLLLDPYWDRIYPGDFDTTVWKIGRFRGVV